MAGDWIKMRLDLQTHPKIVRILSATASDKFRVVGGLHAVWSVFDTHSADGKLDGYSPETLDHVIGWPGFSAAMMAAGWLTENDDSSLSLPEFDEHNGASGKRRAEDQKRKRNERKSPQSVRNLSAKEPDGKLTREEKRREEKNKAESSATAVGNAGEQDENLPRAFTAVDLSIAMRAAGVLTQPANPVLHALAEQGVSPETVTAACEEAKRAKPDEQVGPGYVFKILERWAKDAAALKVAGATAPKSTGGAWWASDATIIAKGAELALRPTPGERMPDFKARIQAAIDNGGVPPAPPRMSLVGIAPAPLQPKSVMSDEMRATLKNLTGRSAATSKELA